MVQAPSVGGSTFAAVNRPSTEPSANGTPMDIKPKAASFMPPRTTPMQAASVPLSARRADALDLNTVERRGQPTQVRLPPKRNRLHDIPEAAVFRPTEEDFRDPMEYLHKIAPEGRKYGIVKIIPPDSWNPDFAIDTTRFHFRVRRQELNSVEGGTRANLNYLDQLAKFHRQHGTSLTRFPSVDKRPLDLYKLKKAVESRGGFESVCKLKKWAEIGRDLGYSGKIMSSLSTSLKNSYQKWLQPYEEYLRVVKPGVQHALEMENGGPFTPSPNPSPVRKPQSQRNTPAQDHPVLHASAALHASMNGGPSHHGSPAVNGIPPTSAAVQPKAETQSPQPSAGGFTPVNPGGFTAVNHAAGFTAVNGPIANGGFRSYPTPSAQSTPAPQRSPHTPAPAAAAATATPPIRAVQADGQNMLKRQLSHPDGLTNGEPDGRRSKRVKQGDPPTVVGSNMHQPRNPHTKHPKSRDRSNEKPGEVCETCGLPDRGDMLLCDSCDHGYHMGCLQPPLSVKPEYDWNCPRCLVGTGEFGFEEGDVYSLKMFQDRARRFKDLHFADKVKYDPATNKAMPNTEDDVEREFWRLVESITETVEVEYGADIHSTTHGSAFPTIEKNPRDSYSTDPWNLNVLPLYGESLFKHIKSDISGMTVPWLYVGMVFSTFCWHNEDHYAYSANYQHFGDTKTWYGIPAEDAEKFEHAMREAVPELFETQPDLLFQLVTLLPPEKLKKAGVRVYAIDQRAGEFVITYPQAYHAGFNHGFNFNEAVNFAPTDWEPYGDAGVQRLRDYRRQPCFSHDELLLTAASRDTSIKTSNWLAPALERMLQREKFARETFLSDPGPAPEGAADDTYRGPRYADTAEINPENLEEEDYICAYCKCFSFLSRYVCKNSGKVLCLLHAGSYECCEDKETERYSGSLRDHTLYYSKTDEVLNEVVSKVTEKARVPEIWAEKVEALLLDEPRPQLKNLRTLLHEGERIPHDLPRLNDLRRFVDRCNEWVEEATNYITRKQSRRKSDKPGRKSFARQQEIDEQNREYRKIENIRKLLMEADEISFECPEIETLRERAEKIEEFQASAREALTDPKKRSLQEYEELAELGRTHNVDMLEIDALEKMVERLRWREEAKERRAKPQAKSDVIALLEKGSELGLTRMDQDMQYYEFQKEQGDMWDSRARELMKVDNISTAQLEGLANHGGVLPVDPDILNEVQSIIKKQREAQDKIYSLCERAQDLDFRKRPKYKEAKEVSEALQDINNKPGGMVDLEKHIRSHEDWMRKGKKLFGKTNAPLHILLQHMDVVRLRNEACFDIRDKPRMPVEPSSREVTPIRQTSGLSGEKPFADVFCICRKSEAGMMIECEICHEWYHGKCLKVARGKVKEDDKYKCPICDWRQKIPRDAARPKLEELIAWQDELEKLPFQPDEEDCLAQVIDTAQTFRDFIQPIVNPVTVTPEEVSTMRFYLRKVEGADLLLAYETNFLRQELHKWAPVTDDAPPTIEHSGSTRKPRPTKIQKLMAQFGVSNPDDLPEEHRQKAGPKRRITEALDAMERKRNAGVPLKPAGIGSSSSGYAAHQASYGISPSAPGSAGAGSPPASAATPTTGRPAASGPGTGMPALSYDSSPAPRGSGQGMSAYGDRTLYSSAFTGRGGSEVPSGLPSGPSSGLSRPSSSTANAVPNLDPALFGSGLSARTSPGPSSGGLGLSAGGIGVGSSAAAGQLLSSPGRDAEEERRMFADMVQDQDGDGAGPDAEGGKGDEALEMARRATEALRGAEADGEGEKKAGEGEEGKED
ncbi:Lid2 complex component lid2 [Elsinoe australis]|uniref:Lid2 complex component lid2 n=1 Tax=Elsinoe australis TaxID=40998 RepID=A0A2P7YL45_9PEZI|nr:Lid2 complex component lid2 [Elsinoe australis]